MIMMTTTTTTTMMMMMMMKLCLSVYVFEMLVPDPKTCTSFRCHIFVSWGLFLERPGNFSGLLNRHF